MIGFPATFFDGRVAADRSVAITVSSVALTFEGDDVTRQEWPWAGLSAIEPPAPGQPLRISSAAAPDARLVISDPGAVDAVLLAAPHLRGGFNPHRWARFATWLAGGAAAVAVAAWLTIQIAPRQIAFLLPETWRNRAGEQIEASIAEGARRCESEAANKALSALMARISEGNPELPPVAIHIYEIPIMNAFAMPGGRILITSELIKRATEPEEVAGVLAHELGHVSYRHSEAQLVRAAGLQVLFAIITGGGGGDTFSQLAGLAAILKYSREAEEDADSFALTAMEHAAIDPMGLKRFFELVLAEEKSTGGKTQFGKIQSVFATHPGTEERIAKIKPLPAGIIARPVMTASQFQDLKAACNKPR